MKSEVVRAECSVQAYGEADSEPAVATGQMRKDRLVTVNDNDIYIGGDLVLGGDRRKNEIENSETLSRSIELFAKIIEGFENLVGVISEFVAARKKVAEKTEPEVKVPEAKTPETKVEEKPNQTPPPAKDAKGNVHNAAPGGGFLWKPVSEKDGNLVVLLPKRLKGKIKGVNILDPKSGKVIDRGRFSGIGNEDRSHYRFGKPGAKFPDGAVVQITLDSGKIYRQKIKETSERFQK